MKKLFVLLVMVIFLMVGCADSGGSSSTTPAKPKPAEPTPAPPSAPAPDPPADPPPIIDDLWVYQVDKECAEQRGDDITAIFNDCSTFLEEQDIYSIVANELVLARFQTTDPDLDIVSAYVSHYLKQEDGEYLLHSGPEFVDLASQSDTIYFYMLLLTIPDPTGEWRIDLWVVDGESNDSNTMSIYVVIVEPCNYLTIDDLVGYYYVLDSFHWWEEGTDNDVSSDDYPDFHGDLYIDLTGYEYSKVCWGSSCSYIHRTIIKIEDPGSCTDTQWRMLVKNSYGPGYIYWLEVDYKDGRLITDLKPGAILGHTWEKIYRWQKVED